MFVMYTSVHRLSDIFLLSSHLNELRSSISQMGSTCGERAAAHSRSLASKNVQEIGENDRYCAGAEVEYVLVVAIII